MARCIQCGAELPDYYTSCPNCGGQVQQGAPAMSAPVQPTGYIPMSQQRVITSPLGWLGWSFLCGILPIIGAIIMLNVTKDQTAKNYAKLMIIMQAIGLVLSLILVAILVPAMVGYIEKAQSHATYYFSAFQSFLR